MRHQADGYMPLRTWVDVRWWRVRWNHIGREVRKYPREVKRPPNASQGRFRPTENACQPSRASSVQTERLAAPGGAASDPGHQTASRSPQSTHGAAHAVGPSATMPTTSPRCALPATPGTTIPKSDR